MWRDGLGSGSSLYRGDRYTSCMYVRRENHAYVCSGGNENQINDDIVSCRTVVETAFVFMPSRMCHTCASLF